MNASGPENSNSFAVTPTEEDFARGDEMLAALIGGGSTLRGAYYTMVSYQFEKSRWSRCEDLNDALDSDYDLKGAAFRDYLAAIFFEAAKRQGRDLSTLA